MAAFIEGFDPSRGLPDLSTMPNPENALIAATTTPEWQTVKAEMAAAFDPYAMKALGRALFEPNDSSVRHRLGELACPVSVIVGEHDHPFVDQAPALVEEVPESSLTVFAGAYHSPQLTHPTEWAAAVEAHLVRASH